MATPSLLSRVIESQWQDAEIVSIRDRVQSNTGDEGWTIHVDGSLWTEVGESSITGLDLIRDTFEKVSLIQQRLLMAQSRQKSYADVRRRPLEFEVGDHVFLKVMPKR